MLEIILILSVRFKKMIGKRLHLNTEESRARYKQLSQNMHLNAEIIIHCIFTGNNYRLQQISIHTLVAGQKSTYYR